MGVPIALYSSLNHHSKGYQTVLRTRTGARQCTCHAIVPHYDSPDTSESRTCKSPGVSDVRHVCCRLKEASPSPLLIGDVACDAAGEVLRGRALVVQRQAIAISKPSGPVDDKAEA